MDVPMDSGAASAGHHFLIVDPVFQDPSRPGQTRGYDLASRLVGAGHRVSVIATGAVSQHSGIAVQTRAIPRLPGGALPAAERGRFARWAARAIWSVTDVDAVLVVTESWGLALWCAFFAKVRAIPLLLDARRLPPPSPVREAPFGVRVAATVGRLVRRLALRFAARTFVASPAIAAALEADGLTETKRAQLPIGCDPQVMALPPGRTAMLLDDNPELIGRQTIVWAGTFDRRRDLARVVDLAVALQSAAPHACLVLCGDGPTRADIIRLIHDRGLPESCLRTLSPLPRARVCELLSVAAAVLAVPTDDDTSSDFFDGLAAGKPVLFCGDGWQRTLLESRGAGFAIPVGDMTLAAREIADILQDVDGLRRAGQQASALAASRFNLDRLIAEARVGIEALIAAAPRRDILRRRTLTTKRIFDVVAAALGLIVLSPVALILAVLIGVKLGWPVVVIQERTGLKGHAFRLFKFRTLIQARDTSGDVLLESARLTPLGRFLRRTSMDEIPTLLNVLIGDMSLVGPRPHPTDYANFYTAAQKRRHDVRPGLTGWAQIDTAGDRTWEHKFARDLEYVDRLSLGWDARIIARTLLIVLRGRDLNPPGQPVMPRFDEMMARREGAEDV